MKRSLTLILLLTLLLSQTNSYYYWIHEPLTPAEKRIFTFWDNTCKEWTYKEKDIPTIFIPWILASWYSEEWYDETNIKRRIPDPITHVYDPLFFTFKNWWYKIEDVFYKDEFNVYIDWNPKWAFYLFWYDWKKDNKITATILTQLIWKILLEYEDYNDCNIWKVNIVAHSMWWLVARAMLEDMCVDYTKNTDWWIKEIKEYDPEEIKNWHLFFPKSSPCTNPYPTPSTWTKIKLNKIITISTPHRGSPKAFPIWEKWDIEKTDWFIQWRVLKTQVSQLISTSDTSFYQTLHWYKDKIPNWFITIWQLLPDLQNQNPYNEKLKYLIQKNTKLSSKNYPKNSFLEELNKQENINKMWDKIEDKYISYYSTVTWNDWNNNIINYELKNQIIDYLWERFTPEQTQNYNWKDIYNKY